MKLFIEDISGSCDDIVCDILSKYLFPRDSGWLQRNKSGLCKGNQVVIGEQLLGDIAHKYAVEKYGPYVASIVGNVGAYFSPVYGRPLKIDINSGRVQLPKFELIATHLERKLKTAYAQLDAKLVDLFTDIADEILDALSEKKLSFESKKRRRNEKSGNVTFESKSRARKISIKEGVRNTQYYDPELEQFEIFLMTRGTDGQDEIREYVDSRRDTGIFGSIGSEYGNISVWVNTESIDDEFMDEVEALIDFAQDHGARLNVKCFNELKDLFTVKQAPYDI
jgi:hypothetical protein